MCPREMLSARWHQTNPTVFILGRISRVDKKMDFPALGPAPSTAVPPLSASPTHSVNHMALRTEQRET
jgi:hypothetical protein